jgi:hypothetical protein
MVLGAQGTRNRELSSLLPGADATIVARALGMRDSDKRRHLDVDAVADAGRNKSTELRREPISEGRGMAIGRVSGLSDRNAARKQCEKETTVTIASAQDQCGPGTGLSNHTVWSPFQNVETGRATQLNAAQCDPPPPPPSCEEQCNWDPQCVCQCSNYVWHPEYMGQPAYCDPNDPLVISLDKHSKYKLTLDLIRFGGHLPKGGYDVPNGGNEQEPAAPPAVHG